MQHRTVGLPRAFGFLLVPQFPMMGFAAATEPLRAANRLSDRELYTWSVVSADGAPVTASSGIDIVADQSLEDVGRFDTLFVVAGLEAHKYEDRQVFAGLRRISRRGSRISPVSILWIVAAVAVGLQRACAN